MKIYYIYHSCFLLESENAFLLFDYFKSKKDAHSDFNFKNLISTIISNKKPLYIFISHGHHDHYNINIFDLFKKKNETYYILSDDIKLYRTFGNTYTIKENEKLNINNVDINAFGSTDEGVSFLITLLDENNLKVFHAGDLNWWKWPDDTVEEENSMESSFKNIIANIEKYKGLIHIAFFPVDKRLEENYIYGGKYFIEKIQPEIFIPMHFWDDFQTTKDFKNLILSYDVETKIIEITHSNEILSI